MAYTTIDDPSAYFHTQLFTGNGSTQSITNDANAGDFKPDWLWIKSRGSNHGHAVFDSNRGGNARLAAEGAQEERTNEGNVTFQTDGFNVTSSHPTTNNNSTNMVAWQWVVNGGTTASNTDGSITSTVQANTTAGFSIVTYTGNGTVGATVGHGLGAVPHVFMGKQRSNAENWIVYHHKNTSAPETDFLSLNLTDATADNANAFNDTAPTSSVMTFGGKNEVNTSGRTYVGYFFIEKQGYSKFGSYTGNGNANGPFVYTGFKPAFVIIKNASAVKDWTMWDTTRYPTNPQNIQLYPNLSNAEDTPSSSTVLDMLSNGFKIRGTNDKINGNGNTLIYMAFAESPFVSSEGVPTTAR